MGPLRCLVRIVSFAALAVAARVSVAPSTHCYANLSGVRYHDKDTCEVVMNSGSNFQSSFRQVWQLFAINPVLIRAHLLNDTTG